MCSALGRIARYVRHRIIVECDGVPVEGRFLSKAGTAGGTKDDQGLVIVGMRGDSALKLEEMSTTVTIEIGESSGDYHGHYSAIVPRRPAEVHMNTDRSVW